VVLPSGRLRIEPMNLDLAPGAGRADSNARPSRGRSSIRREPSCGQGQIGPTAYAALAAPLRILFASPFLDVRGANHK